MTIDLSDLERLAKAATTDLSFHDGEEWTLQGEVDGEWMIDAIGKQVADCEHETIAKYIVAVAPSRVLELLRRLRAAEAENVELKKRNKE